MRRFIFICAVLFTVSACEKIPDNLIDAKVVDYQVFGISAPLSFIYSSGDSSIVTTVKISNVKTVQKIWCKVSLSDGTLLIYPQIAFSFTSNINPPFGQTGVAALYTGKIPMSKKFSSGNYQIEYFVEDNVRLSPDNLTKVGTHIFSYNNGQNSKPPVIVKANMPSSVAIGEIFAFSVQVNDPDGLNDIKSVTYELYKPDGTKVVNSQGISKFPLFDDGNISVSGDETAGDGIYTVKLTFPAGQQTGVWRFDFQAADRADKLSNVLSQQLTVR